MRSAAAPRIRVTRAGQERIDDLEPLRKALHDHLATGAPQLADVTPFRSRNESWARRASHEAWLQEPEAFTLIAERESTVVGYALVATGGGGTMLATGERVASLETLSIVPPARGQGMGGVGRVSAGS